MAALETEKDQHNLSWRLRRTSNLTHRVIPKSNSIHGTIHEGASLQISILSLSSGWEQNKITTSKSTYVWTMEARGCKQLNLRLNVDQV
jgi:hypothetical protein